jgi:hypothetical protein
VWSWHISNKQSTGRAKNSDRTAEYRALRRQIYQRQRKRGRTVRKWYAEEWAEDGKASKGWISRQMIEQRADNRTAGRGWSSRQWMEQQTRDATAGRASNNR